MSPYLEYLESNEWWIVRRTALIRVGYRCERELPNEPRHEGPLEVHHRKYDNLGHEPTDDLEVLCAACHRAETQRLIKRRGRILEQAGQLRLFDRWEPIPPRRRVRRKIAA